MLSRRAPADTSQRSASAYDFHELTNLVRRHQASEVRNRYLACTLYFDALPVNTQATAEELAMLTTNARIRAAGMSRHVLCGFPPLSCRLFARRHRTSEIDIDPRNDARSASLAHVRADFLTVHVQLAPSTVVVLPV